MKKERGFILFLVLIFLNLYSLLSLTALEGCFLTEKLNKEASIRHRLLVEARKFLSEFEKRINESSMACLVPGMSVEALQKKSLAWWSRVACANKTAKEEIYGVIEYLGENPCARLAGSKGIGAIYYRLTLLLVPRDPAIAKVFLQKTVAIEHPASSACQGKPYVLEQAAGTAIEV